MNKKKIETTLDWIKEVKGSCRKIEIEDTEKVLKNIKRGEIDHNADLLEEIRDQIRDRALLELLEKMLIEDYAKGQQKGTDGGNNAS